MQVQILRYFSKTLMIRMTQHDETYRHHIKQIIESVICCSFISRFWEHTVTEKKATDPRKQTQEYHHT